MNKAEFLIELEEILQREEPIKETDKLDTYEEWDSLSKMSVVSFFNKAFGIRISMEALSAKSKVESVSDIINLAGDKIQ